MSIMPFILDAEQQFPAFRIENIHGTTEISLYGGHILGFTPKKSEQFTVWKNPNAKYRSGKAIRGGIPICFPWFGKSPIAGLPQHGFARISYWTLHAHCEQPDCDELVLMLTDTEETRALWPHKFEARLLLRCGEHLTVTLEVKNTDALPWEFSAALHTYLGVSDIANISLEGLNDATYLDSADGAQFKIQHGPLKIAGEVDAGFLEFSTPENPRFVTLIDSGKKYEQTFNLGQAVQIWNPGPVLAKNFDDFADEDYKKMLCLEGIIPPKKPIILAPNDTFQLSMTI